MSGGADSAGDEMVVGRTNESEERTILVTKPTLEYAADFVLSVGIEDGGWTSTKDHQGVDAIQATGAIAESPGGAGGITEPAANGVVGRGLNGLVGYPHPVPRDRGREREAEAGVFGAGGIGGAGVFGRGRTGVIGYEQDTDRDPSLETKEPTGVLGCGPTGGFGVSEVSGGAGGSVPGGPGVHGVGTPGVFGEGQNTNPGVAGDGGDDGVGVVGRGHGGPGMLAQSDADRAAVFESSRRAQIFIVPLGIPDPTKLPDTAPGVPAKAEPGELCVTFTRDVRTNMQTVASLWFCKQSSGLAATANWVQIA
jgi:hypothetical protein